MDANTLQKQLRIIDNQANILTFGSNHYFAGSIKRISPIEIDKVTNEHVKELYKKICIPHDCSKELDDQRRVYQAFLNTKEPKLSHTITSDVLAAALQNTSIKLASPVVSTPV